MKRFSEQLKKKSDSIRMRASERRELRERLVSYMEYHPVVRTAATPKARKKSVESIVSDPFKIIFINMTYVRSFAGVFALFLVVGVPLIAERAVPGDILYPVKVQFNEEVRSTLSLSPYAKVEWETQRLERRIAEARLLADEGRLTQEIEAEVAQAVKEHTSAAQKEIATLRESDSDEAAIAEITFASALAVQSEVLEGKVASDEANKTDTEGRSVVALAGAVAEARTSAENTQANTPPSFEKLLGRVELETTRAYELFASVRVDASEEEVASIERRLADIERKIAQAISIHNEQGDVEEVAEAPENEEVSGDEEGNVDVLVEEDTASSTVVASTSETSETSPEETGVAPDVSKTTITLLRTALTDTQKLLSFMTDIDVRLNVSIEELVPVTLTDEERLERVTQGMAKVLLSQKDIVMAGHSADVTTKIEFGAIELERIVGALGAAIDAVNLDSAETLLPQAQDLVSDLVILSTRDVAISGEPIAEEISSGATSTEELLMAPEEVEVDTQEVVEVEEEV